MTGITGLMLVLIAATAGPRGSTEPSTKQKRPPTVTPFLMFTGQAEEAMKRYIALFKDGEILQLDKYGEGEAGAKGKVKVGRFSIGGQQILCTDSPPVHEFTFTPSTSLFVNCNTEEELDGLFTKLSKDGSVLMPPGNYDFSQKFAWVVDRFGVSWQLNLPDE